MSNLSNLNVGDFVAVTAIRRAGLFKNRLMQKYHVLIVVRKTATSLVACDIKSNPAKNERIRMTDGRFIGSDMRQYQCAIACTREMLTEYEEMELLIKRFDKAHTALSNLLDKPVHKLDLSLAQMEHLAKAWDEAQKMENPL